MILGHYPRQTIKEFLFWATTNNQTWLRCLMRPSTSKSRNFIFVGSHFLVVHVYYSRAVERAVPTEFKYTRDHEHVRKEQQSRYKNVNWDVEGCTYDNVKNQGHIDKMMACNNMHNPILVTHVIAASVLSVFMIFGCILQHFDETTTIQQLVYNSISTCTSL